MIGKPWIEYYSIHSDAIFGIIQRDLHVFQAQEAAAAILQTGHTFPVLRSFGM